MHAREVEGQVAAMNAKNKNIQEVMGSLAGELHNCTSKADVKELINREIENFKDSIEPLKRGMYATMTRPLPILT